MGNCGCGHSAGAGPFAEGRDLVEFVSHAHGGTLKNQSLPDGGLPTACQGCGTAFTLKLLWPVAPSVVEYMPYHHPAVEIRPISNLQVLAISYNDKRVYLKAKITIWEEIILAPVYLISTMLLAQEASPASRHVAWQQRASDPVQVVS